MQLQVHYRGSDQGVLLSCRPVFHVVFMTGFRMPCTSLSTASSSAISLVGFNPKASSVIPTSVSTSSGVTMPIRFTAMSGFLQDRKLQLMIRASSRPKHAFVGLEPGRESTFNLGSAQGARGLSKRHRCNLSNELTSQIP